MGPSTPTTAFDGCKHVHICKTNFLDKKVRARGQFYQSYFHICKTNFIDKKVRAKGQFYQSYFPL